MTKRTKDSGARPDREDPLLAGKTIVVAGGTGSVGRRLVEAQLDAGANVVVPSRSGRRLEELRSEVGTEHRGRLITLEGNVADEGDGPRIRDEAVGRAGPPDAVVASLGRFAATPSVLDAPRAALEQVLGDYLLAHFSVARTFVPALEATGGSYTFINGPLAFEPTSGGGGLVSIATAAQAMLARTVIEETAGGPVRVNEVVLYTPFGWDEAEEGAVGRAEVARYVALLVSERGEGVRGERIHLDSRAPLDALGA